MQNKTGTVVDGGGGWVSDVDGCDVEDQRQDHGPEPPFAGRVGDKGSRQTTAVYRSRMGSAWTVAWRDCLWGDGFVFGGQELPLARIGHLGKSSCRDLLLFQIFVCRTLGMSGLWFINGFQAQVLVLEGMSHFSTTWKVLSISISGLGRPETSFRQHLRLHLCQPTSNPHSHIVWCGKSSKYGISSAAVSSLDQTVL